MQVGEDISAAFYVTEARKIIHIGILVVCNPHLYTLNTHFIWESTRIVRLGPWPPGFPIEPPLPWNYPHSIRVQLQTSWDASTRRQIELSPAVVDMFL